MSPAEETPQSNTHLERCGHCGERLRPTATFCDHCGVRIERDASVAGAAAVGGIDAAEHDDPAVDATMVGAAPGAASGGVSDTIVSPAWKNDGVWEPPSNGPSTMVMGAQRVPAVFDADSGGQNQTVRTLAIVVGVLIGAAIIMTFMLWNRDGDGQTPTFPATSSTQADVSTSTGVGETTTQPNATTATQQIQTTVTAPVVAPTVSTAPPVVTTASTAPPVVTTTEPPTTVTTEPPTTVTTPPPPPTTATSAPVSVPAT